jgi:hypothetical protein
MQVYRRGAGWEVTEAPPDGEHSVGFLTLVLCVVAVLSSRCNCSGFDRKQWILSGELIDA